MQVRVLLFGQLKESAGFAEQPMELPQGASVEGLLRAWSGRLPEQVLRASAIAVNRVYAAPSHVLNDGDEVAILPPVSGGVR